MLTGIEGPAFNVADFNVQRRPCMGSARQPSSSAPKARTAAVRRGAAPARRHRQLLPLRRIPRRGYNPFVTESDPNDANFRVRNLSLAPDVPIERLEDRKHLLESLDASKRSADSRSVELDPHAQRAFSLLTSKETAKAFDIASEPKKLRDAYGRHTFGQSALLARRLVEAGVTFVTVNCVPWDHHGTANRLATKPGAELLIPPFDPRSRRWFATSSTAAFTSARW